MLPSLHIEPTNRCTLSCPRCARTIMNEQFGKGKNLFINDLDKESFEKFVDIDVEYIVLCGTHGDPIYHNDLINLAKVAKQKAKHVIIITNGSYRSASWWKKLTEVLDENDEVIFSIDGIPENFAQYRINADWKSIEVGIKICVSSNVKVKWKFIIFSFNENCIEQAKELSHNLGIDEFEIHRSDRWVENDWLKPTLDFKTNRRIGNREDLHKKLKNNLMNNNDVEIDPICKNNTEHYINASGYYMPCCFFGDFRFYYKSSWWKNKEKFNIKTSKLSDQMKTFDQFYKNINSNRLECCVFNCGKC